MGIEMTIIIINMTIVNNFNINCFFHNYNYEKNYYEGL